jgi:hypothetical protein
MKIGSLVLVAHGSSSPFFGRHGACFYLWEESSMNGFYVFSAFVIAFATWYALVKHYTPHEVYKPHYHDKVKRRAVTEKIGEMIKQADKGGAHFIPSMRLQVAREIHRQLEMDNGGANDSATGGAQPQPERILQQPTLEHTQQDSKKNPYNGPRALATHGHPQG